MGAVRASPALFCVWCFGLGRFSLCDPAPAHPHASAAIWSYQMTRGSQIDLVLPDDTRHVTSSQGAVRAQSGRSQGAVRATINPLSKERGG